MAWRPARGATPATASSTPASWSIAPTRGSSTAPREAAADLFALALRLGGTVTGEHGIGVAKAGQLQAQWPARAVELHEQVKRVFDPKNLFNPGKKLARPSL